MREEGGPNTPTLTQLFAVLCADRATVDDSGALSSLGRDLALEPLSNGGVNFLGLLGSGDLAGSYLKQVRNGSADAG